MGDTEAMVDPDVVIAGVIEKGKLLTLTTGEALRAATEGSARALGMERPQAAPSAAQD